MEERDKHNPGEPELGEHDADAPHNPGEPQIGEEDEPTEPEGDSPGEESA